MSKVGRFVSYAFCVGDVFIEIDPDLRITAADGALRWLGMDDRKSIGHSMAEFMDRADFRLLATTLKLLGSKQRIGPIVVQLGATPSVRRLIGIFLSHLPGEKTVQLVGIAKSRLEGVLARPPQALPDEETFLNRLPTLISDASDPNSILVSLIRLGDGEHPKDRDFFTRQLAAMSLGGQSAAEFGDGRFAVVHEKDTDPTDGLMDRLARLTGENFESATLDAASAESGSDDVVRALVYSVRKFADTRADIDLKALSQDFSENFDDIRERIANLRRLIRERRFHAAYQPIVSLSTGDTHHVEALVRFDTRSGSPFELITFAEQVGMIGEFDMMMMANVTNTLTQWADKNNKPRIAMNLSARSLTTEDFQEFLVNHLAQHHELKDHLLIEVTESAQITDLSRLSDSVKEIRAAGFKVCLDDFGAGASGFQYLRNIKVDYVKVDGAYIRGAENDPELRAFLHAMTTLCNGLGIKTIAEHVETDAQADLLRELGADYAQGFYFGHPLVNISNALRSPGRDRRVPAARAAL